MTSLGKNIWINIKETNVGSLRLCFDAFHVIEKLFWLSLGILGAIFMSIIVYDQIKSWHLKPIMSTRKWVDLSEVDFPAITFCHQGNTRLEFVERLVKAAGSNGSKIRRLRNLFLETSVEYLISYLDKVYMDQPKDVSFVYNYYCPGTSPPPFCNTYGHIFGYAQVRNISIEQVYKEIYNELVNEEDITDGLIKIGIKFANSSATYNISNHLSPMSKDWLHLQKADTLLNFVPKALLEMPMRVTRSIMQQIPNRINVFLQQPEWKLDRLDEFHEFFMLPNDQLNIMAISHLYTMTDFGQLGRMNLFSFQNKYYLGGVPTDFQNCFKNITNSYYEKEDNGEKETIFMEQTPCSNLNSQDDCHTYCKWHKEFIIENDKLTRSELMYIMKHSLPQRKLEMTPLKEVGYSLAKKIFGSVEETIPSTELASMPLIIFCKNKQGEKWHGDDIGIDVKFCHDFYSTPTDNGLCLTKNLNFKSLVHLSGDFHETNEFNDQDVPMKIQGDRLKSQATFVINTNARHPIAKTFSRSNKEVDFGERFKELGEVKMQIHSTNELPQIEPNPSQRVDMDSLTLVRGKEYFITVTPLGQKVTEVFKELDFEQRECLTEKEIPHSSQLKVYTEQNCRHECKVNFAIGKCQCIPWDFPIATKKKADECDVFGRTCFFNVLKHTAFNADKCPQCSNACEFMMYRKTMVKEKEFTGESLFFETDNFKNCPKKELCEYLSNVNGTIDPLTWYERMLLKQGYNDWVDMKEQAEKNFNDLIIVHVNFDAPEAEINILDLRYSFYDKLASLGGTIGLAEQITGASFLTLIHLIVLIIKAIFNYCFTNTDNQ